MLVFVTTFEGHFEFVIITKKHKDTRKSKLIWLKFYPYITTLYFTHKH